MRMYDIISKKRDNFELNRDEIKFFVNGYVNGTVEDYHAAALLMAICLNGMTNKEISDLTDCMIKSGEISDLSSISGIKVDKHSTGGVGDKTTMIVGPIAAACGVKIAKMSGRGLGYTGGTIDKLESIPGMCTELKRQQFFDIVNSVGFSISSQTGNLVPADKKIYALRDVTATVESIPLIASSIMSKKIAAGADCILLDVKAGSGAFMKSVEQAIKLAEVMVGIGNRVGKKTVAVITNMDCPLGAAIGNSVEIQEACDVLRGAGPTDLCEVSVYLASNMLYLAGFGDLENCKEAVLEAIKGGKAFEKFKDMVLAQGGDISFLDNMEKLGKPDIVKTIRSNNEGYIISMDAEKCGIAAMVAGAGREKKGDSIDFKAGIRILKSIGDYVKKGEPVAQIYSSDCLKSENSALVLTDSIKIGKFKPRIQKLIKARVTEKGIEML